MESSRGDAATRKFGRDRRAATPRRESSAETSRGDAAAATRKYDRDRRAPQVRDDTSGRPRSPTPLNPLATGEQGPLPPPITKVEWSDPPPGHPDPRQKPLKAKRRAGTIRHAVSKGADRGAAAGRDVEIPRATKRMKIDGRR